MDNTKTYVASVAMHSAMGDPTTNLDRIAEWSSKAHDPLHSYNLLQSRKNPFILQGFILLTEARTHRTHGNGFNTNHR